MSSIRESCSLSRRVSSVQECDSASIHGGSKNRTFFDEKDVEDVKDC